MGIGLGIVLLVIGLILATDAVSLPSSWQDHIDGNTLGWILIIVGALAIILALVMNAQRSRTTHVEERRTDQPPPPRV
ncbi:DUF6458 family protein [Nocardioides terrisoli]|uniref:DUF6458 family protein n=1 Tax=Nocardioides terrisoli TaxID=3388267 RepID=UPI00287B6DD0|nr:DUF6458 family protein [Nocardioides marmorisolisilvae]